MIVREVVRGIDRFAEIQERLGISRRLLSDRLEMMVDQGILVRVPYKEAGQRRRHAYELTAKGRDLIPVLTAMRQWGDKYVSDPEGPPLVYEHVGCGAPVHLAYRCEAGHEVHGQDEIVRRPGPSARWREEVGR